ncbi:helix-turn-helix domain-containing protein [Histophilus somni]|uniref:RodZ domain-containing protein n=1 Tax=Histophilus somni TaxID=731 RepID=UPI000B3B0C89|nr:RodZ family helix-turn-helix domain-containing protein [Histophilus somni]ARU65363.1 DNA-binding protein [Histophilus somni]ARU73655.1 DNA-binding protein [Histophilus somni]
MTNLTEKLEETASNNELLLGERFRMAREKLQLSLDDVSKQINLRPAILQLLENNEFTHKSIPTTFMKGYVRNYAKFLRIPEEIWTKAISSVEENTRHNLGKNTCLMKAVNGHSSHGRWIGYVTVLVLLIVSGMTVLWWWGNYQKSNQERDTFVQHYVENVPSERIEIQADQVLEKNLTIPVEKPQVVSVNETTVVNKDSMAENKLTSVSTQEQSAVQNPQEIVSNKTSETEKTVKNTETFVGGDLQIEIIGASCWISVKDAKHKVLAQKEYKQGEVLVFTDGSPYSLIIGAPSNVKITYKGEHYPLKVDGRVAKFKLQ